MTTKIRITTRRRTIVFFQINIKEIILIAELNIKLRNLKIIFIRIMVVIIIILIMLVIMIIHLTMKTT